MGSTSASVFLLSTIYNAPHVHTTEGVAKVGGDMALTRWDPFSDLRAIHTQMDDVFNQMFTGQGMQLAPRTDVYIQDDNTMVVEAHLPNFKENEVNVDVHQGALEIRAEHTERNEDKKNRRYLVRESSSSFYRRIALSDRADEANIKADFKDGLLKITIPFKELPRPKNIAISGGGSSGRKKK